MSNKAKELRSQLRQIVKDILPEIMSDVIIKEVVERRVKSLEEEVKKQLHEMNTRHKDVMGYLVRQVSTNKKDGE